MKPLISESLIDVLVEQIAHEKYNANLYLYMASFLNSKGLSNIAKHFIGQFEEEEEHSMMLYYLLVDLGVHFDFPVIMGCSMVFSSMLDLSNAYLDREIITTDSLNEIKRLSIDDNNPVVEQKIREMISLQQNEYAEATDFVDKSSNFDEWWKVAVWDISISE